MKLYMLVSINNKTGTVSTLTATPATHKECMTIKSKCTEYKFRTITIIEANNV